MINPPTQPHAHPSTAAVCLAGALTLAVAMGLGRFAFTPLLPLMMRDGLLDASGGAGLAAVNYVGYLLGALSAARVAAHPLRLVRACLVGTAMLTAGVGLVNQPAVWLLLRLLAGICSAWAMVGISAWALGELGRRGQSSRSALVYAGVGLGIALAGSHVWLAGQASAPALWVQMGAVAAALSAVVLMLLHGVRSGPPPGGATSAGAMMAGAETEPGMPAGAWGLLLCYCAFGIGYSLPVTFLPAQARLLIDDPRLFGLAWPAFGLAAALATVLSGWLLRRWRQLNIWAAGQMAIAVGAALPSLSHSGWAIGMAALLVGGSFMIVTMVGLQQARALAPQQPARLLGRMTAAFALGQILGPSLVRWLGQREWAGLNAIDLTALPASAVLAASAWWLWRHQPDAPQATIQAPGQPKLSATD